MTALTRTRRATRLAALISTSVVVLAGCGTDEDPNATDSPGTGGSSSSAPTESSDPATSAPTDGGSTSADEVAVPVYFAGDTPQGTALFREFRKVEADNPLDEAVALAVAGDALDPDYRTLLPSNAITSVTSAEGAGAIVVQLADDSWGQRPDGMSKKDAKLALQQIVYTVQGVQQSRDPVLFQVDADPATVFGIDTSGGVEAAPELDVLAFVNVTSPEEGARVPDNFNASGVASSFEGTVPWEIRDGAGTKVLDGFGQAEGYVDKLYPWESQVDVSSLAPGSYTFVAMTDDPSGGEGGGPTEDTKTITVE